MKLLMVTHYFDSHPGGIEFVAREVFQRLARPQCEVTWAAANASAAPEPPVYGSTISLKTWNGVERSFGIPFPVPGPGSLKKLWTAVGANDVVLIHDCLYLGNITAFVFARLRHIPVMIVQHIGAVPYRNLVVRAVVNMANAFITRFMLKSASQVVFISQIPQRHFRSVRFSRAPVVLFNGINTQIFSPIADDPAKLALRARLGLPHKGRVALFVGRFVEKKGIQILKRMAQWAPEITWAFAGSGPSNPKDWNLTNVRVYIELPQVRLVDVYRASDVFVLPSVGEGFPLVLQEALACGLPVVCGAETVTADDALAAFVVGVPLTGDDQQSAKEFLSSIYRILEAIPSTDTPAQRFRFVQDRYSWPRVTDTYYDIALKLANLPVRHPRRVLHRS